MQAFSTMASLLEPCHVHQRARRLPAWPLAAHDRRQPPATCAGQIEVAIGVKRVAAAPAHKYTNRRTGVPGITQYSVAIAVCEVKIQDVVRAATR